MAIKGLQGNQKITTPEKGRGNPGKKGRNNMGVFNTPDENDFLTDISNMLESIMGGPEIEINFEEFEKMMNGDDITQSLPPQTNSNSQEFIDQPVGLINTSYSELGKILKKYNVEKLDDSEISRINGIGGPVRNLRTDEELEEPGQEVLEETKFHKYVDPRKRFVVLVSDINGPGYQEVPTLIYVMKTNGRIEYYLSDVGSLLLYHEDGSIEDMGLSLDDVVKGARIYTDVYTENLFKSSNYQESYLDAVNNLADSYFDWFGNFQPNIFGNKISDLGEFKKFGDIEYSKDYNLFKVGEIYFNDSEDTKMFLAIKGQSGIEKTTVYLQTSKNAARIDPDNHLKYILEYSDFNFIDYLTVDNTTSEFEIILDFNVDKMITDVLQFTRNLNR